MNQSPRANHTVKPTTSTAATNSKRVQNAGLPNQLKTGVENTSGMRMDNVKVHYNSSKPATVQAHASTQDKNIHLAPGQKSHLSHELGHVVQQMNGRVQSTTQIGGVPLSDNPRLEKEADALAAKATNFGPKPFGPTK